MNSCLILVVLSTELLVGHSIRSGLVIQSLCICLRYESTILFNLLLLIFFLLPSVESGLSTMMAYLKRFIRPSRQESDGRC
jgi:hypothetical protein